MELEERPAGVLVGDVMTTDVHVVKAGSSVKDTAAVMAREGHGCVIVVNGAFALGMVTERDIVHKVTSEGADPAKVRVDDIMSTPLITIPPDATLLEAARKMTEYEIRRIVVVDGMGRLLGLLTAGGIANWLARQKNYADPSLNAMARLRRPSPEAPYR